MQIWRFKCNDLHVLHFGGSSVSWSGLTYMYWLTIFGQLNSIMLPHESGVITAGFYKAGQRNAFVRGRNCTFLISLCWSDIHAGIICM